MRRTARIVAALSMAVGLAACEVTKTENPLSPSVAGPIPGVEISAPKLLEPEANALISGDRQPITLLIENAYSTGQRPLNYSFEVATDAAFSSVAFAQAGVTPGDSGRTALTLPTPLGTGRIYYWRAKAQDGANTGPYSSPVGFNVFTPISFDKPFPVSPVNGARLTTQLPEFVFNNAPRTGSPASVSYVIELASNSAFAGILAAWQFAEQPAQTKFTAPSALPPSIQLYWRVRAFEGGALGPWSDVATFVTPTPASTRRRRRGWHRRLLLEHDDAAGDRRMPTQSVQRTHGRRSDPRVPPQRRNRLEPRCHVGHRVRTPAQVRRSQLWRLLVRHHLSRRGDIAAAVGRARRLRGRTDPALVRSGRLSEHPGRRVRVT